MLATDTFQMPPLIYGTAWKKERTATLVTDALTAGFRGIDTACQPKHYNEAGVGEALAASVAQGLTRSELYVQTKYTPFNGHDPLRIPYDPNARLEEQVRQSFEQSLRNLQTDYLDALILHSPLDDRRDLLEVWRSMESLCDTGCVHLLGISNCYELELLEYLWQQARIKPSILQNRFYAATHYDQDLRVFCRKNQIIYQSFWTLTANPQVLKHPELQTLAKRHQKTVAQIFFRYLNQIGIVPLTGTTDKIHMLEDLAIVEFSLSEPECVTISELISDN